MPFGPEISWPYGFRQMDPEARELIESAYRTGPEYQQPAVDDYGYGDPGYSDPTYEGPKTPYNGPAFPGHPGAAPHGPAPRPSGGSGYRQPDHVPGYHVPETRDSAPPAPPGHSPRTPSGGVPMPGTGPQPAAGGSPRPGASAAYPEQWYDHPRLDDRAAGDLRRPADPRLEGMNYGELRYDDPDPRSGDPGDDDPLDESWYDEPRRGAPGRPQRPGDPGVSGPAPGGAGLGGPRRRPDGPGAARPSGPGPQPGSGFPPVADRPAGPGQPRGPQLSAGRNTAPGPESAAKGTGFLAAPVGLLTPPDGTPVALLTPPVGSPIEVLRDVGASGGAPAGVLRDVGASGGAPAGLLTAPDERAGAVTVRPGRAAPRPGHGLDGPEVTSSWPVQPAPGGLDSYDDFWRNDEDEEYTGLFGDREAEFDRADAKQAAARQATAAKRGTGRRRGRSNDHRLWLALGGVVVVAAAAIAGILRFEFPSHRGPAHTMTTPAAIGGYTRTMDLERQTDVAQLRNEVIEMSSGQASSVRSAVYEKGNSQAGNTEQIIMFIGGHLANAAPAASITSFTQKFPGARMVSAGSLGGKAACVQEGAASNAVAMCAWFDDDSFGEVVSPTMNATALATAMQTFRPAVEHRVQK